MHTRPKVTKLQQTLIKKCRDNSSPYTFFNLLTSDEYFSVVESLLPEHRERKFPPTETLSMFLAQAMNADRSCQNTVNEMAVTQLHSGMFPCSSNTGSYCKARARLPLGMVTELVRHTGTTLSNAAPTQWKWKGRAVRLVDGTSVALPDTNDNQQAYPQTSSSKGCPLARIVGLICLASGSVLNAAIGPFCGKGSGEQSLLRELLDTLKSGDILLGDAYFGAYFLLAELMSRNVDVVFEQYGARKRKVDFGTGETLGKQDHLVTYSKPTRPDWLSQEQYEAAPATITIRELKVDHKILITTLCCPKLDKKHEIGALYRQRWHVELDLRNIKATLGMGTLTCKTSEMIEKEIWVYLLAHNLIRAAMAEAAASSDILPRQLSFKHSLQLWRKWQQQVKNRDGPQSAEGILLLMLQNTVGHRPGRVEPRAIKRWEKSFPLLTRPRAELRAEIRLNGHPKKAA